MQVYMNIVHVQPLQGSFFCYDYLMENHCQICGRTGYHYCAKLDTYAEAADINRAIRRHGRDHTGAIAGAVIGGLVDGGIGAALGFLLGDSLDRD